MGNGSMSASNVAEPLGFVQKWMPEDLSDKTVLDYACGGGRHGILALNRGADVTFADIKLDNLKDQALVSSAFLLEEDLEREADQDDEAEEGIFWPLCGETFDLVIVTNYLYRPRLKDIFGLVKVGGMIIYQTFAEGNARFGRPSNPNFLLRPQELLNIAQEDFDVLHFEQGDIEIPSPAHVQRIVAIRH